MQQLRLLALTAGMTGLIWVAADQRVTRSVEIDVPFQVKPASGDSMALTVVDSKTDRIQIEFRGPSRTINRLRSIQDTLSIELEVSERDSGKYELTLLDELRTQMGQMGQFPDGVAIVSTSPTSITIDVDHYVDQPVRLVVGAGNYEFDGPPQLDPSKVIVKVPEKQFKRLSAEQKVITIPVDRALTGEAQEGQLIQKAIPVPKVLDGGLGVIHVEPQQVTLSATLLQRIKTDRIRTVPIRAMPANLDLWDRYQLKFTEAPDNKIVTRLVVVRGPTDIVTELVENASKYNIFGYININRDDVEEGKPSARIAKPVHVLNLPKGVELVEEPEPVEIELVPRF